ncbi:probable flavin-containing monoamine oxidase A isoform X3 [Salmo trutta]|uniref:probable flavin-containing monoamine oxidase A isoform X3 n=1 Tax=Salmo trutta TaxID=8032 RepID=UPI001131B09C|nr:probable flavin-containing monoamine oxidase A isoform X3 [Salmo trutta]
MTEETWDVVIVGAGLSGLSAAQTLRKRNGKLRILILEGKDRVGGRTVTQELPAAHGIDRWDMGGQWVGSTQTYVMDLIQEFGLEVYTQYTTGKKVHHVGGPHAKVRTSSTSIPALSTLVLLDLSQLVWKIDRLSSTVSVEDPMKTPNAQELDSMTLHSYIEKHAWTEEMKEEMGVCSRVVFGMEPNQMSFLYFIMYAAAAGGVLCLLESTPGSAQEFRVKTLDCTAALCPQGGTQQLSERLAQQIGRESVRLGQAVTAIWQDAERAKVMTATHSYLCRAVIVTCPPHLAAKIHYQPALPIQREHLTQNMPVGHMMKFVITYQMAFWREKGFSGEIVARPSAECPLSVTFDGTSPSGSAALVGFISGVQAYNWSSRELSERRDAVILSLVKYLGEEAASYIHYEEKDWALEEYSGGCPVNVMAPGMLTYYHPSLCMPCGRIHWAGTETATKWCGYMDGAIQSGQRAALEVLARLCPFTLTQEEQDAMQAAQNQNHDSGPCQHLPSTSHLRRALILTTLIMATAVLLAQPQLCRDWIGQARQVVLRRFALWQ